MGAAGSTWRRLKFSTMARSSALGTGEETPQSGIKEVRIGSTQVNAPIALADGAYAMSTTAAKKEMAKFIAR